MIQLFGPIYQVVTFLAGVPFAEAPPPPDVGVVPGVPGSSQPGVPFFPPPPPPAIGVPMFA